MVIIDREKPKEEERNRIDKEVEDYCSGIKNLQLIDKLPLVKDDRGKNQPPTKSVCKLVSKVEGREYMLCFDGGKLLKNGERLYYPSSFFIEGTRNIKPVSKENKMLIWFLTKVMPEQTLKKARIHINDVEEQAKEANKVDMDMFDAGILIKRNLVKDQIILISPSWGVSNTDKDVDVLRKELWDKVVSKAQKDNGKSYTEFIRQAKTIDVSEEVLVRTTVRNAVLSKDIIFEKMGWRFKNRDGQICYVNPKDNERKEEILIEFLMNEDDSRNGFLVAMGVKKDDNKYSIVDLESKTLVEINQLAEEKGIEFPDNVTLKRERVPYLAERI